jgi:tRNA G10  N-methylase Trm11
MKEILATYGISGRFVMSKDDELSSVTVAREHIRELVLVQTNGSWIVGKTLAVQQFAQWAQRDYGRPFSDPKSGMLPPKVARMAVNIALGQHASGRVLYDPFCGMGTILAEALMRGATVLGSDQASDAVSKTKANLDWLVARTPSASYRSENIFVSDATHASTVVAPNSVDAIVTEPFMGSSGIAQSLIQGDNRDIAKHVKDTIRGLEKLYIGCFKDWLPILKDGGKVVIALPVYAVKQREFFVKKVIDTLGVLGYTTVAGPIEYSRPQAVVRRRFFVFQKN